MAEFLKSSSAKTVLLAMWGSGVVGVALYQFIVNHGQPLPPELGMAFGGVIGFVTGGTLSRSTEK